MTDALAIMHWEAQVYANDCEFALASPRLVDYEDRVLPYSTIQPPEKNNLTRALQTAEYRTLCQCRQDDQTQLLVIGLRLAPRHEYG